MPDPAAAFAKWIGLLKPGGIAILIEGSWSTGAGLTAARAAQIVRSMRTEADVRLLTESVFWGKEISDERFLIVSKR
jgi:hypothetical protein